MKISTVIEVGDHKFSITEEKLILSCEHYEEELTLEEAKRCLYSIVEAIEKTQAKKEEEE